MSVCRLFFYHVNVENFISTEVIEHVVGVEKLRVVFTDLFSASTYSAQISDCEINSMKCRAITILIKPLYFSETL